MFELTAEQASMDPRWSELSELALEGLQRAYARTDLLPHTLLWDGQHFRPSGSNVRYGLISLLGLARAHNDGFDCGTLIDSLWGRVAARLNSIAQSPGDLGLCLWAQSLDCSRNSTLCSAKQALDAFRLRRRSCDSVHLAWLMLGADHLASRGGDVETAEVLAAEAWRELLGLYNPRTSLFYRHGVSGPLAGVLRRVPCFAHQIYAVMALAVHARRTGCPVSRRVAGEVADTLCRLQGQLGQWWWLYDARQGAVVDGYPVFSVHQDAMAPMALLETSSAGGRSYESEIRKGLAWIDGNNELGESMVRPGARLVLRELHRKGVGRPSRAMRSALWCLGWRVRRFRRNELYVLNSECRPYHLGWILYAVSLMRNLKWEIPDVKENPGPQGRRGKAGAATRP